MVRSSWALTAEAVNGNGNTDRGAKKRRDRFAESRLVDERQIAGDGGAGQMQDDALFCLPDLDRDFEQLVDDRRWLRLRQRGVSQSLGAQLLMQDVGGGVQQQPHEVGEEARA